MVKSLLFLFEWGLLELFFDVKDELLLFFMSIIFLDKVEVEEFLDCCGFKDFVELEFW